MKNIVPIFCFATTLIGFSFAATLADAPPATQPATTQENLPIIRLWDNDAPGALGGSEKDIPTLTLYMPTKPNGAAVIVCPGGGYDHYGAKESGLPAKWLNSLGITAFVLKYRLGPTYHHPIEMEDAQRAIRLLRARASDWNLNPKQIGILGFSAGGHLASTTATHFDDGDPKASDPIDRVSCRPDLALLIYPVITMSDPFVHARSRQNLLGDNPDPQVEIFLSSELQVSPQTPPCFLVETADDHTTVVENSLMFAMACHKNNVPVELHVFEHGKHGFALGGDDPVLSQWPAMAAIWLAKHGFGQ
jgi:acetyl esterase/lipase